MFKRAGILGHPLRPGTDGVSEQIANSLIQHGIDTWTRIAWDNKSVAPQIAESDLIIAIGGDGAMLRTARLCAAAKVPVFGINTGHLGFLTETNPAGWLQSLESILRGDYWIEERMMLRAEAWRGDELLTHSEAPDALNDVVISRGASARSVLIELYIDEGWATTYNADGLIISTPTGSTAYALAVGGPILPPELKNLLVVAVAPHLSLDRPLVLSEGATVQVTVGVETQADVMLTVDGDNVAELQGGDTVVVQASPHLSRFIRLREHNYFYRSLLDRMEPRIPVRHEPNGRARPITTRRT